MKQAIPFQRKHLQLGTSTEELEKTLSWYVPLGQALQRYVFLGAATYGIFRRRGAQGLAHDPGFRRSSDTTRFFSGPHGPNHVVMRWWVFWSVIRVSILL